MTSTANTSFTADEKRAHVQAYMSSKLTQQEYCKGNGLKTTSFKNWSVKYGRKQKSDFVPIVSTPKPKPTAPRKILPKQPHIEIIKDDCKIVLCNVINVATAIEIIRVVLSCS